MTFGQRIWEAELHRLNPNRKDVAIRLTEHGAIVEYDGEPPVMPPWPLDDGQQTCPTCAGSGRVSTSAKATDE